MGGYRIRYGFPLKMSSKQRLREVTPSEKRLATEPMKFKEYKILKFSLLQLLEIHIRPIRLKKEILGREFLAGGKSTWKAEKRLRVRTDWTHCGS